MKPIDITAVSLPELRYLVALADQRHFGRAARACSVTQPTLSTQIKKLERTLGSRLFERTSKSVHPTSLGERVVAQARLVLEATGAILDLARSEAEPLSGPLRLGVIPTLAPYLLPWLVPPLRKAFPRLHLVFRESKTVVMLEELAQHKLDVGILALPFDAPGIDHAPLFDEPFFVLVRSDHALASRARVREADLAGERVLLLDEGHCLRDQALAICGSAALHEPDGDFRATSIETLRHMVAAGMGCTLLPALALSSRIDGVHKVAAVPFAPPSPSRRMALAWRRTHPRAKDFQALADVIRGNLPEGVVRVPARAEIAKRAVKTSR